tara:strand:+ start:1087 stop:1437 length:351 start_codon:yes stop_codon:yes gene_type:complete
MREISKELGYVYFTSDGKIFAEKSNAEFHQSQVNYAKESQEIIVRRLSMDAERILKLLKENGWGVYYKANPINLLGVKGGEAPIFSVNDVDNEILLKALKGKQGDTQWHSETDSEQ